MLSFQPIPTSASPGSRSRAAARGLRCAGTTSRPPCPQVTRVGVQRDTPVASEGQGPGVPMWCPLHAHRPTSTERQGGRKAKLRCRDQLLGSKTWIGHQLAASYQHNRFLSLSPGYILLSCPPGAWNPRDPMRAVAVSDWFLGGSGETGREAQDCV